MEENKNEIIAADGEVTVIGVTFREAGKVYYFSPEKFKLAVGDRVIVNTSRGLEIGTVRMANKSVPVSDTVSPLKPVLRKASAEDIERDAKNRAAEVEAAGVFKKKVAAHKLDMALVAVEYTFDNSKLIFYFSCESRVDFRELVKDLASTFRTRIELRQIGIRDEAKMMGGLGPCGRKFCCASFLTDFVQVSIKMAKEQSFSLNSGKVSGVCGKLMCCLRYEHDTYEEAIHRMPPLGSTVKCAEGTGVITEIKPLAEEIRVKLDDNEKDMPKLYKLKDVKILRYGKREKNEKADEDAE
jgi:cell fate regulator YaaT (PSP1 superfamily)